MWNENPKIKQSIKSKHKMYENKCLFIHFVDAETPQIIHPTINKKHRNFRTHPFYQQKKFIKSFLWEKNSSRIHSFDHQKENKKSVKRVKTTYNINKRMNVRDLFKLFLRHI